MARIPSALIYTMSQVRVLVVDNQPIMTLAVRIMLERTAGYMVREETDPLKVVEAARAFRPDVILLDVDMPLKNGAEVARDVRKDPALHEVPIVFLSGLVTQQEIGRRDTAC